MSRKQPPPRRVTITALYDRLSIHAGMRGETVCALVNRMLDVQLRAEAFSDEMKRAMRMRK